MLFFIFKTSDRLANWGLVILFTLPLTWIDAIHNITDHYFGLTSIVRLKIPMWMLLVTVPFVLNACTSMEEHFPSRP